MKAKKSIDQKILLNDPVIKEKMCKFQKEYQNRPDVKEKTRQDAINMWKNQDHKNNFSKKMKDHWSDPNYKEQLKEKRREYWRNPQNVETHLKKSFMYKDYTLPSGSIVKLQGYEPIVLDILLNEFVEDDIIVGVKNIHNCIGKITYILNDSVHSYYPDFYIKSINKIIEVKSKWTYEKHEEKNLAKEAACKKLGLDFEFIIL